MNRILTIFTICLLSSALVAGCHEPAPTDGPDGSDDGQDGNGEPQTVTLTVEDAPDLVSVNETFNVTVAVAADDTVTSSHFGAHWSYESTKDRDAAELTPADFDGGSPHVLNETQLGDTYVITNWTFGDEHVGTIYFRAHVLTADHYWSDEQMITVAPSA